MQNDTGPCPLLHPSLSPGEAREFAAAVRDRLHEIDLFLSRREDEWHEEFGRAVGLRLESLATLMTKRGCPLLGEMVEALHTRLLPDAPRRSLATEEIELALAVLAHLRREIRCMERIADGWRLPAALYPFLQNLNTRILKRLRSGPPAPDAERRHVSPLPLRILVADDEEMLRAFFHDILTHLDHAVMVVDNGRDALQAVDCGFFDLVFTDINMPGADGIEVLRETKILAPEIEVVIITGYASVENAADAVRFGAYDYLTKPFQGTADVFNVVHRVEEHLALHRRNALLGAQVRRRNEELKRYVASLEDALRAAEENRRALIHADRMATLGTLSAGVAHEINNPTTFIRGNVQTLKRFWEDVAAAVALAPLEIEDAGRLDFILRETPKLLQDMLIGTERIAEIVAGLRAFAHQGEHGTRRETDLRHCLEDALQLVRSRLKYVNLRKELDAPLPKLRADPQQMTQVFVNLLVNALDAVEEVDRPSTIRIALSLREGAIVAEVEDNGPGIPEAIREKVFDPFFTTKRVGQGTGLGLSILQGIVADHGGHVEMESTSNEKTVARITLPLTPSSGTRADRLRVLVADSHDESAALLQQALGASEHYAVETTRTGFETIYRLGEHRPDLVVLDLYMPDIDAMEILLRLRTTEATRHLPVLAVANGATEATRTRLAELGAGGILNRPFDEGEVLHAVAAVLERKRAPLTGAFSSKEALDNPSA